MENWRYCKSLFFGNSTNLHNAVSMLYEDNTSAIFDVPTWSILDATIGTPFQICLEYLNENHPNDQFVLLMGEDNLIHFDQWKEYRRILDLVQIYVYPRTHEIGFPESLLHHEKIQLVNAPKLDFASKNIRKILQEGKSVESLMPHASWVYLQKNSFYK